MKDKISRELICLQRSLTNKLEQSPLLSVLIHACKSVGEKLDKFTHFVSTRQTAIYPFLFTVQTHLRHRVCMTWIAINLLVGGERAGRSWEHFCAREKLICLFIKLPAWIYIYTYTHIRLYGSDCRIFRNANFMFFREQRSRRKTACETSQLLQSRSLLLRLKINAENTCFTFETNYIAILTNYIAIIFSLLHYYIKRNYSNNIIINNVFQLLINNCHFLLNDS